MTSSSSAACSLVLELGRKLNAALLTLSGGSSSADVADNRSSGRSSSNRFKGRNNSATAATGQEIAMMLRGLQGMGSECYQVQLCLSAIADCIKISLQIQQQKQQQWQQQLLCDSSNHTGSMSSIDVKLRSSQTKSSGAAPSSNTTPTSSANGAIHMTAAPPAAVMSGAELSAALGSLRGMGGGRPVPWPSSASRREEHFLGSSLMRWHGDPMMAITGFRSAARPRSGANIAGAPKKGTSTGTSTGPDVHVRSTTAGEYPEGYPSPSRRRRYHTPQPLVAVLSALETALKDRAAPLTASQIAQALYGLQGLSTDTLAVRRILAHLRRDLQYNTKQAYGQTNVDVPWGSGGGSGRGGVCNRGGVLL